LIGKFYTNREKSEVDPTLEAKNYSQFNVENLDTVVEES
jgi:hypothetical protein